MIRTTLSGVPAWYPALAARAMPPKTTRIRPSVSKPTWVAQLNKRGQPRPVGAERGPIDGERRGAGVGSLQAAHAEQQVGQVADQDQKHRLGERESERHEHRAVHQVLEVDAGARPHAEQVTRGGPPLPDRDVVDAALLDPEGFVGRAPARSGSASSGGELPPAGPHQLRRPAPRTRPASGPADGPRRRGQSPRLRTKLVHVLGRDGLAAGQALQLLVRLGEPVAGA